MLKSTPEKGLTHGVHKASPYQEIPILPLTHVLLFRMERTHFGVGFRTTETSS